MPRCAGLGKRAHGARAVPPSAGSVTSGFCCPAGSWVVVETERKDRSMEFLLLAVAVVVFDVLATRFGADTRDGRDWSSDRLLGAP